MITAICNVYINSEEKLSLFKGNFSNVYEASDNWLVHIRGKFKGEAVEFVKNIDAGKNNCIVFEKLFDNDWAKSTRKMIEKAKYDYLYVFLEDHFLMKSIDKLKEIAREAIFNKSDYFSYSFFNIGMSANSVEILYPKETNNFFCFDINKNNQGFISNSFPFFYPYSLASISSKIYFDKLLKKENDFILLKIPSKIYEFIKIFKPYPTNRNFWSKLNNILKYIKVRLVSYSPATPFNLERSSQDLEINLLPVKIGVLKEELFANWDDDNGLSRSSLVKRGLYPTKLKANEQSDVSGDEAGKFFLKKGDVLERQYFPEKTRISKIPIKFIKVINGDIKVYSSKENYQLKKSESIAIYANIPHKIEAVEDSAFKIKII